MTRVGSSGHVNFYLCRMSTLSIHSYKTITNDCDFGERWLQGRKAVHARTGSESKVNSFELNSQILSFSSLSQCWVVRLRVKQIIYDATQSCYWKIQDSTRGALAVYSGKMKMRGVEKEKTNQTQCHDDDDGKWEQYKSAGLNCIALIESELKRWSECKVCLPRKDAKLESWGHHAVRSMKITSSIWRNFCAILPLAVVFFFFLFFPLHERQQETNFSKICLRANKSRFYRVTWFIRKCCCTLAASLFFREKEKRTIWLLRHKEESKRYQRNFSCAQKTTTQNTKKSWNNIFFLFFPFCYLLISELDFLFVQCDHNESRGIFIQLVLSPLNITLLTRVGTFNQYSLADSTFLRENDPSFGTK